jgi:hypothetical protein
MMEAIQVNKDIVRLAAQHPDLPVVALVKEECVPDDGYRSWYCQFASASVKQFVLMESDDCSYAMYDKTEAADEVCERMANSGDYEDISDAEFDEIVRKRVSELEWQEAIVVTVIPGIDSHVKEEII